LKQPGDVLEYSGSPLVEIKLGGGRILASEMNLGARNSDPVAGRLLANMVGWLVGQEK
jgi:hypothetical protein